MGGARGRDRGDVFMPQDAPMAKVDATRLRRGVEIGGAGFDEALAAAQEFADRPARRSSTPSRTSG